MIPSNKLQNIKSEAGDVVSLINISTQWVNSYLKDESRAECRYELKRCRRQINKIKEVVTQKPVIALFGASQVGKSYMANNLLYNQENILEVYNHQNGNNIDFIKFINPEGKGNEATGAVTRFTADLIKDPAKYPVKIKTFSVREVICILCDTYFNDFKDQKPLPKRSEIAEAIQLMNGLVVKIEQQIISDDDIYLIKEYLDRYFKDDKSFIVELEEAGFWDELANNITFIEQKDWVRIFSILWNYNSSISNIFLYSLEFLSKFNFPKILYVNFDAIQRLSGKAIINVQTLQGFFQQDDTFEIQTEAGDNFHAEAGKLCFLTAEIILSISEGSIENRPFIKNVDIVDFPGARSRPEVTDLSERSLLEMMLRGKVSFLFNSYSTEFKTNVLSACMRTQQTNVTTVPRLVHQWICDNLGSDAVERGQNITNGLTPLFIIFTWWNTQLEYKKATDDPNPQERIEKLFETRFRQEIIGDFKWHEEWIKTGMQVERFRNFYLLRDFKESLNIFNTDSKGAEETFNPFRTEDQAKFHADYFDTFLKYHKRADRFFVDPKMSFEEASIPNKDGSEWIIRNLIPVSSNTISVPVYINYLNKAVQEANESLKKHYHSDKADDQIKKAAKDASDLQLKMDIVFGIDAYLFGSFIEHLQLQESEILSFYHKILQSDKLVKKKNTNTYTLLRIQNPTLDPNASYSENLDVLRQNYNLDTLEETEKHFVENEKIDLNELFYGSLHDLQNNSVILAEEARDYWFNSKLNLANFELFIAQGFEKTQLNTLFDTLKVSFQRHNLVKIIASEIRNYVDVQKKIEQAEEMIAHISAGLVNEFVNSVGWTYYTAGDKQKITDTNHINRLNLKIPVENEVFESMEKTTDPQTGTMALDQLIDYMDDLNENLNKKPVDAEAVKHVPMIKAYQRWCELMKVAFISNCNIPTYNVEANNKLGKLLEQIEKYHFSVS